jgi:thioredoxin-related protein
MKTPPARFLAFCSAVSLLHSAFSSFAPAQEADWRLDYAQARQEAQQKGRPLLIDCSTANCYWCQQLDQQTFRDPAVAALLAERFVTLRLDYDRNRDLVDKLHVQSFPTLLVAAPDGHILGYQEGFVEAARFREQLQRALAAMTDPEWMTRDYEDAAKAAEAGEYARALSLLKAVLEDGKHRPVQDKARRLLDDLEGRAAGRLADAKRLADRGQTAEAAKSATELAQQYAGSQAARDATQWAATLTARGGASDAEQRRDRARDLLARAREDYRAQQFLCCLDRCETLAAEYGDLSEGDEAGRLALEIKTNPEWAKAAADQVADRLCVLYLALADSWLKKGQPQQAVFYLERVVQAFPNSRQAEAAQARLSQLQGPPVRSETFKK